MAFLPGKRLRRAGLSRGPATNRLATLFLVLALVPLFRLALPGPILAAQMQTDNKPSESGAVPPKSWIDKDTGHRVWRVSDEPNSGAFYFNVNAFTPDDKQMVYNSPDGIRVLDLATMTTRLLVANTTAPAAATTDAAAGGQTGRGGRGFGGGARAIVVGHKTNSIFFTRTDPVTHSNAVYKADTNTGAVTRLIDLPPRVSISSVNADETLGAGTYNAADCPGGNPNAPHAFLAAPAAGSGRGGRGAGGRGAQPLPVSPSAAGSAAAAANPTLGGANVQSDDKGSMMERRLAQHIPVVLFTIRLTPGPNGEKAGHIRMLLHSTDWIGHMLFSPTNTNLLMYCHEGMWQKVDRIWLIHTDGTGKQLIHRRTMVMEIAGHEFWGLDGKTIWYDWQYPKGEDFFVASYNLETHKRIAYHLQRNEWSIHFNLTKDLDLFCGDGGDSGQVAQAPDGEWIELFRPQMIGGTQGALNGPDFFQPGVFHSEHLVNMAHQNYRAEPNPRFSPDKKYVFFTSNMFGRSYVFAVEVAKATDLTGAVSTPELATQYNPTMPTPTTTEK
jgi:oligogalacturonide lyase